MYIKHYLSEPDVRFPPTDLHSISAFMQASSVQPSAISAYPGTRNQEQDTWEQNEGLRLHTYTDRQR